MMALLLRSDKYKQGLYFNKYRYRARLWLPCVSRTRYAKTIEDFKTKINYLKDNTLRLLPVDRHHMDNIDWDAFERWFDWRLENAENVRLRLEGNIATIYTNDLATLPNDVGDLTAYEPRSLNHPPPGIKYFARDPKFKYRVYLRMATVPADFYSDLEEFYKRFKDSSTKINFSGSLRTRIRAQVTYNYISFYSYSNYFIEYNDEYILTLLHLQFSSTLGNVYKLEKQPQQ